VSVVAIVLVFFYLQHHFESMVFKRSRIKGYLSTSLCLNSSGHALLLFITKKITALNSFLFLGLIAVSSADASFIGIKTVFLKQQRPYQLYFLNKR